jgi:phosphoribosylglycinamide formyltransferase-1
MRASGAEMAPGQPARRRRAELSMKLAILLSGRGSNFEAIHAAIAGGRLDARIVCVLSNRPDARGIERARQLGLPAHVFDHKRYPTREAHEEDVLRELAEAGPDFIALAGYMRLLSPAFVAAFPHRILNIHPSLLPSFPGVDAQAQAVAYGVKVSGCTVHFVDENLDAGPILVQRAVVVREDDDASTLAARILEQEHEAYVEALVKLATRRYRVEGRRVVFG